MLSLVSDFGPVLHTEKVICSTSAALFPFTQGPRERQVSGFIAEETFSALGPASPAHLSLPAIKKNIKLWTKKKKKTQ